jgi:non-lysosomal glucosylceramidase
MDLFDIPPFAPPFGSNGGFPAGGFGCGNFDFNSNGEFRNWRVEPDLPKVDGVVYADRFHVWCRQGRETRACTLAADPIPTYNWPVAGISPTCRHLFPFEWRDFNALDSPVLLQSLNFSPLIPGSLREASLPVYIVVWRAYNRTPRPLEAALMLTWASGWPDPIQTVEFDLQHDNLCITGSLGDPRSPNRQGIAVPDLHSEGIYLQGIEPWSPDGDGRELWNDFADNGELDPAMVRKPPHGAAAWVKFELDPGETKEVPFVIVWHFPTYETGPFAGRNRYYTQFLGKIRPDNAIVWLAEEVVQNYGTESANYKHWISQIQDWHESAFSNPAYSAKEHIERTNELSRLQECGISLTTEGGIAISDPEGIRDRQGETFSIRTLWPEIVPGLTGLT